MAKITVSDKIIGAIKPMHGVGEPPFFGMDFSYFHFLKDAGIPFSRLHDVGLHHFDGIVDVPYIFRDFSADVDDENSYDFAFTDELMKQLDFYGIEPFFRLGVSIENYPTVKTYYINPPSDYLKWAKICEHIILHYTCGWANGFKFNIRYWEIWNEPDSHYNPALSQMWNGKMEEYFEFYNVSSKYLKEKFPHLKIGGYASCGFYSLHTENDGSNPRYDKFVYYTEFFNKFLPYCRENNCPLDYFSWHSYNSPHQLEICAKYVRKRLDEEGFTSAESILNEWHCIAGKRGSAEHASQNTAFLLACQKNEVDATMFYDARIGTSAYGGLFNPFTKEPLKLYYGFMAFNELYKRQNQLEVNVSDEYVYAIGAKGEKDNCLVIANYSEKSKKLDINIKNIISCKVINEKKTYENIDLPKTIGKYTVLEIIYK